MLIVYIPRQISSNREILIGWCMSLNVYTYVHVCESYVVFIEIFSYHMRKIYTEINVNLRYDVQNFTY